MNPIRFWLLFAGLVAVGIVGFCTVARADTPAKRPVVKLGQPSRVLVRLGTAYRAEYRRPCIVGKPKPCQKTANQKTAKHKPNGPLPRR